MASNIIKIGSKVKYRGGFGMDKPTEVTIKYIEKAKEKREKYGEPVSEIPFNKREYCTFDLDNGHWCYGEQIDEIIADPEPEKEYRVSFRAEVYVKGKDLKSAREKFEDMPIFSVDALEHYGAEFIELESVERTDDESYEEVTTAFKRS